jgi:RNA-binding protein
MALSSAQKRYLRGLTHHINPVVIVGGKGLTDNVLAEIRQALEHHELIKVRLRADRDERAAMISAITRRFEAELVHKIGQVACFFRRNSEKPVVELPRD